MQSWSLDTMGTTNSKVTVSPAKGRTANGNSTGKSQKTRSVKTTSPLHQTDGTYARTESPPRNRDQGCQVQDFNYTGGACTAVGRCTKEELMAELALPKSHNEQGELANGFARPSILASYKPFDEVNVHPPAEKKKRFGLTGRGTRQERIQQMVEYASTTDKGQSIPSARIQLVQAKTTNKSSTPSDAQQQTTTVVENQTTVFQHAAQPAALRNANDSATQNQTDEKIAQRKSLIGLLKKGVERTANAEASKNDTKASDTVKKHDNEPTSDVDEAPAVGFSTIIQNLANAPQHSANVESHESASNQTQIKEGVRRPAGRSLTKLFHSLDIDEDRVGDWEKEKPQPSSKKESSGRMVGFMANTTIENHTIEAQNPSKNEAPTKGTQRAGKNEGFGKLFGRTAPASNAPQKIEQPADQKNVLQTVVCSSTAVESSTSATLESSTTEAQNAPKKEGFGRLFNRTGQSTSSTRRPMNQSNTVGYTLTTTETTTDANPAAQNSTRKESSTKTVEYSLTTTGNNTKEAPKKKFFGRAKTIGEPETTYKNEGRTKSLGLFGQSYNVSAASGASGDQHQTMESHTTTTTAAGHTEDAQNPSTKEASTKESQAPPKTEGRSKLIGRIGQSTASGATGNRNQMVESQTSTTTVESDTNKATVAGHTEESVATSKKEGRTKLFGRIGQSYNVSSTPAVANVQQQAVESHTTTTTVASHTTETAVTTKKEGRTKLFGRIGQSSNVSTAPEVSGEQHKTVESHTTTTTVESHSNEPETVPKKEGGVKLFGRIGQSSNVTPTSGASGNQNQTVESHTTTSTIAGHTEGSDVTAKKEGRSKLFGRIGQSYNVSPASGVSSAQHQLFGRTGQSTNTVATTVGGTTTTTTVETHISTSAQSGQPTSSSGTSGNQPQLVSYSATTDSQRPRDKAGFAKFFQGRINAKAAGDAK